MATKKRPVGRVFEIVNVLKQKVGSGGFPAISLQRAQEHFDSYQEDPKLFVEIATPFLEDMKTLLERLDNKKDVSIQDMRVPVLDLKANGAMFGYKGVTAISSDILDIFQKADEINDDIVELYRGLYLSVKTLIENGIADSKNKAVINFDTEIRRACARYRKKYGLKSRVFKK